MSKKEDALLTFQKLTIIATIKAHIIMMTAMAKNKFLAPKNIGVHIALKNK